MSTSKGSLCMVPERLLISTRLLYSVEEVNMFHENSNILHFTAPKGQSDRFSDLRACELTSPLFPTFSCSASFAISPCSPTRRV